jgi:DNA-binding GntR family transcriptional regulator
MSRQPSKTAINRQKLASQVYQYLLSKLASRNFPIGTHLNASDLAKQLGASRTTVRKAVERLIEDGWAQVDKNRRPVVVDFPEKMFTEPDHRFEFTNQTQSAYRSIHEKILRGQLRSGDSISAQSLVDEFGVSMVTIRQALDWLCRDGLLVRIPRRGWRVVTLGLSEIQDVYRCRLLLEPLALKEAIKHISDATLDILLIDCEEVISHGAKMSQFDRLDNDMKFHRTIADNARSLTLSEAIEPLIRKRIAFTGEFQGGHQPHTFGEEHKAILNAIRNRDTPGAAKLLKAHLRRALNGHVKVFKREKTTGK